MANNLEQRIAALENDLSILKSIVQECCGSEGPGPGRPCRSGRAVIVSGYELVSVEHALELLGKAGMKEKGAGKAVVVSGYELQSVEHARQLLNKVGIKEKGLPPEE